MMDGRRKQTTVSSRLRAEGNTHYARAKAEGIAPFLRQARYEEALKLYNKAIQAAGSAEERSSACKNAAIANRKIAETMREKTAASASPAQDTVNLRELYHWQHTLLNFSAAKASGEASGREDSLAWTGNLYVAMSECFLAIQGTCLQHNYEARVEFLQRLQQNIPPEESCIWQPLQALLSETKFNESVCLREAGGYIAAIRIVQSALQDINILLDNSQQYGKHFCGMLSMSLHVTAENALAVAEQQERICQAMQACALGDEAFDKALMMSDELSVELVWDAVDYYHHSLLLAKDREVEQEAIAYSRLTKVFDRVLKMKSKAETYAKRTAELAEALMPRNLHTEPWYRDAMVVLERIRLGRQQQEQSESEAEMKKYKEELKDELEALNDLLVEKASRGDRTASHQEILIYVYSVHPPVKFPSYELPAEISGDDLKSLFKKALVHYHPDKVDKEAHGMKWFVLCSEIAKILGNRYERLK